jgi:hypothetical protein
MLRDLGLFLLRRVEVSLRFIVVDTQVVSDLRMRPPTFGGVAEETESIEQLGHTVALGECFLLY